MFRKFWLWFWFVDLLLEVYWVVYLDVVALFALFGLLISYLGDSIVGFVWFWVVACFVSCYVLLFIFLMMWLIYWLALGFNGCFCGLLGYWFWWFSWYLLFWVVVLMFGVFVWLVYVWITLLLVCLGLLWVCSCLVIYFAVFDLFMFVCCVVLGWFDCLDTIWFFVTLSVIAFIIVW